MTEIIALLVIVALAGGAWLGVRRIKRKLLQAGESMLSLVQQGASTTARITRAEKRRMSRGQFEYFVTYTFRARDGSEHAKENRVPATHFNDYTEGQEIDIVYLPADPSVSATREMVDRVRNTPS